METLNESIKKKAPVIYKEEDMLECCFFTLYNRLPVVSVSGYWKEFKTNEAIFFGYRSQNVNRVLKRGKLAVYEIEVDGEMCKCVPDEEYNGTERESRIFFA